MITLYDNYDSGNGYKVRLMFSLLAMDYTYVEVDSVHGETRHDTFLKKNPNGKIPVVELEDGSFLPESSAILHYLANGTRYLPTGRLDQARVLQWMFFEQYTHEPYIGGARFIVRHLASDHPRQAELPSKREQGHRALKVMEHHLASRAGDCIPGGTRNWFVANTPTIADLALFAYTHMAADGGIELTPYPAIRSWLTRVQALPGFVSMADSNHRLATEPTGPTG